MSTEERLMKQISEAKLTSMVNDAFGGANLEDAEIRQTGGLRERYFPLSDEHGVLYLGQALTGSTLDRHVESRAEIRRPPLPGMGKLLPEVRVVWPREDEPVTEVPAELVSFIKQAIKKRHN